MALINIESVLNRILKQAKELNISESESGYYKWVREPDSFRSRENQALTERIKELYAEHNGKAGAPMITADLKSEECFSHVGHNRAARIMRENNLRCRITKKYRTTTDSRHSEPVAANILNRKFNVSEPDKAWVRDITYLRASGSQ